MSPLTSWLIVGLAFLAVVSFYGALDRIASALEGLRRDWKDAWERDES